MVGVLPSSHHQLHRDTDRAAAPSALCTEQERNASGASSIRQEHQHGPDSVSFIRSGDASASSGVLGSRGSMHGAAATALGEPAAS